MLCNIYFSENPGKVQDLNWHPSGNNSVTLTWMPPSDKSVKFNTIQYYSICVEPSKGCDSCQEGQCFTSYNLSYTITSLALGVNYNFIVRAMNCQGEGPPTTVRGSLNNFPLLSIVVPLVVVPIIVAIIAFIIVVIIVAGWKLKRRRVSKPELMLIFFKNL